METENSSPLPLTTDPIFDANEMARKIRDGYEPTREEMVVIIQNLRTNRAAVFNSKKEKITPLSKDEIFGLFDKK